MIEVRPLAPKIGAEILNIDARKLDAATFKVVYQAFLDHVLVLTVNPGGQINASRTLFNWDNLVLNTATVDTLHFDIFATVLTIYSGASIDITGNDFSNGSGLRYVDRMAGRCLLDGCARSCGHLALGLGRDHAILGGDQADARVNGDLAQLHLRRRGPRLGAFGPPGRAADRRRPSTGRPFGGCSIHRVDAPAERRYFPKRLINQYGK